MGIRKKDQRGFTLIELLVVVAIIGILAAIGIWNYMAALHRAKQKQTMANIRSMAVAWESYATDAGNYIPAGFEFPTPIDFETLHGVLVPDYAKNLPLEDAWKTPFDVGLESGLNAYYAIRSRGKDGLLDDNYDNVRTQDFNCDIIYSNGQFAVWPGEGLN